ncbi:hypothetical protein CRG98_044315, partial [Punica granatum]
MSASLMSLTSPPSAPSSISTKLSFIPFSIPFPSSSQHRPAPNRSYSLSLKSQPAIVASLSLLSLPKHRLFSAAFDGFEAEG